MDKLTSKLWKASRRCDYQLAIQLINRGAKVNEPGRTRDDPVMTLLHAAAAAEDIQLMRLLIDHGGNLHARDSKNRTPLHWAVTAGDSPDIVEMLINKGADMDVQDIFKSTPLHMAVRNQYIESAQKLIARGASIEAVDINDWSALHLAVFSQNLRMVKVLISHRINIDAKDIQENTPLLVHLAVEGGNAEITVSVTVSVLTLTFISIDRWYAICFPLRFKSTTSRAKTAIIIIWVLALLIDIPELLVLRIRPGQTRYSSTTILFTQCEPSWSQKSQIIFTIIKFILLYTGPLLFMSFAYCQIVRVLWKGDIPGHNLSTRIINPSELSSQSNVGNPEGQLKSRRKAAKMLVAVVLMFALCCFPVHLFSILRSSMKIKTTDFAIAASCIVHLLFYANSAINPLIYNFMSGKFRKEFKRTFCCPRGAGSHNRAAYRMAGTSKSNYNYYYNHYPMTSLGGGAAGRQSLLVTSTGDNARPARAHTFTNGYDNNNEHDLDLLGRCSTEVLPLGSIGSGPQQPRHHHAQ